MLLIGFKGFKVMKGLKHIYFILLKIIKDDIFQIKKWTSTRTKKKRRDERINNIRVFY